MLQNNLTGIYIHGSIAFNCFNWEKSDIDYIVVVNRSIPVDVKNKLMKETLQINNTAPQKGLEMSVVLKKHCMNFIYPTPYDLHYSNNNKDWYENNPLEYCEKMNGVDKDLAAHFTVIKHVGIVLCGEPVDGVFGEIPKECYFDSIKGDIQGAKELIGNNPVYFILNLCRALAYKDDGLILSKEQGGHWGIKNLDCKYNSMVKTALDDYAQGKFIPVDSTKAVEFCEYMHSRIFR